VIIKVNQTLFCIFLFLILFLLIISKVNSDERLSFSLKSNGRNTWSFTFSGDSDPLKGYIDITGSVPFTRVDPKSVKAAVETHGIAAGNLRRDLLISLLANPFHCIKELPEEYSAWRYCSANEDPQALGMDVKIPKLGEIWSGRTNSDERFWGGSLRLAPVAETVSFNLFSIYTYPELIQPPEDWFTPQPQARPPYLIHAGGIFLFRTELLEFDIYTLSSLNGLYAPGYVISVPFNVNLPLLKFYGGFSRKIGNYFSPSGRAAKEKNVYSFGIEGEGSIFEGSVECSGESFSRGGRNLPFLDTKRSLDIKGRWKWSVFTTGIGVFWKNEWNGAGKKVSGRRYRLNGTLKVDFFKAELRGNIREAGLVLKEGDVSLRLELKTRYLILTCKGEWNHLFSLSRNRCSGYIGLSMELGGMFLRGEIKTKAPIYPSERITFKKILREVEGELRLGYSISL